MVGKAESLGNEAGPPFQTVQKWYVWLGMDPGVPLHINGI